MPATSFKTKGTLIVIGQPSAALAKDCFSGKAARTVIVEPDPALAAETRVQLEDENRVSVIAVAVTEKTEQAELATFNFPGLRSLRKTTAKLLQLFPGLQTCKVIPVKGITPTALMAQIGDLSEPVHVVINLPGSEHEIVKAWQKADLLRCIDRLDLNCSSGVFFRGGRSSWVMQKLLAKYGFDLVATDDDDPDFPWMTFEINPMTREVASMRQTLTERDAALEEVNEKVRTQTEAATAAQAHAVKTEATLEELREALSTREAALAEANKTIEESKQQGSALDIAKDDLSVALRMQLVLQSDLSELRKRFAEVDRQRAAQEELLGKLTPRLQEASEQIRYLSLPREDQGDRAKSGDES
jgi:hypothetical protein